MTYENHINKFIDAAAIQAAIDNGDLLKPYVALDASAGTIDYNTRSVTPVVPTMGEWSIDSDGHYVFTLLESAIEYWENPATIGYLNNVYVENQLVPSLEITLEFEPIDNYDWLLCSKPPVGLYAGACLQNPFPNVVHIFGDGRITTNLGSSDATVQAMGSVDQKSFSLYSADPDHPLTMTTVNPPYPSSQSSSE